MKRVLKVVAAGLLPVLACGAPVHAQEGGEDRARAYAALAELPALEGVWQIDWGASAQLREAEAKAPLTPAARRDYDQFQAAKERGENLQTQAANCIPTGMPGAMRSPYPIEVIHSPGKVTMVIETNTQVRHIYTDGRPLPEDPDLLFNGTSVGQWEGSDLIVDTVGLTPMISLLEGIHPTPQTRIRERIRLIAPGRMTIETTIADPALFTRPYVSEVTYALHPDWTIREYVCQENNRDGADELGRPSMELGFPEDLD